MTSLLPELEGLARILLAAVLAAAIGWEREAVERPAGLRTHMLVAISAALFTTLALSIAAQASEANANLRIDTTRVLEAIVTGVAFLGAGTIFSSRGRERVGGLTTAASLLATAAIGAAVAIGTYALAFGATVLLLVVLGVLRRLEHKPKSTQIEAPPKPAPA